jgi:hypothetical protein
MGSGMPKWLPLFLLAVIPALIVGIVVALVASGGSSSSSDGSGDSQAAAIIDGFIHSSPSSDSTVLSYKDQLAPGFPKEFPLYKGAKVVASFSIMSSDGANYFAVLSTNDDPDKVYTYYQTAMDKDPYQVDISTAGEDFTGVRFTQVSNPDVAGEVAVHRSDLDKRTNIYVTFQASTTDTKAPTAKFVPSPSRSLPDGFPASDVPVYKGKADSIVTDTYKERSPGGIQYIVSFITKDSQDDVMSYYRKQFGDKKWTVSDSSDKNKGFAIAIDFDDGANKTSGSVAADAFDKDNSYTKVDLYVMTNTGSGAPAAPGAPTAPAAPGSNPPAPNAPAPNAPAPATPSP